MKILTLSEQRKFFLESKPVVTLTGDEFSKKEVFLIRKLLDDNSNPAHIPAANQGVTSEFPVCDLHPTQSMATNKGNIAKILQKIIFAKFDENIHH